MKYGQPTLRKLSGMDSTEGAPCRNGSAATDCTVGASATNNCNSGSSAQQACHTGFSAVHDCRFGSSHNALAPQSGGVTTINPLSDNPIQFRKR